MFSATTPNAREAANRPASGAGEDVFLAVPDKHDVITRGGDSPAGAPSPGLPSGRDAGLAGTRVASVLDPGRLPAHGEATSRGEGSGPAAAKRPRLARGVSLNPAQQLPSSIPAPPRCPPGLPCSSEALLGLPKDVLVSNLFARLDGVSLGRLACACQGLGPLAEDAARSACMQSVAAPERPPQLWSNSGLSWKQRLHLDYSSVGFDLDRCERGLFKLSEGAEAGKSPTITLQGMGPKLLVSNVSTVEQRTLRWSVVVEGNTAIEFGVVPLAQQDLDVSLHKAKKEELADGTCSAGFASDSTFGSELDQRVPIFRGTVVDIVARQGQVDYKIWQPDDAKTLCRNEGCSFMAPYSGPKLIEVSQTFPDHYPIKLACTLWARCCMRVLQPLPQCSSSQ